MPPIIHSSALSRFVEPLLSSLEGKTETLAMSHDTFSRNTQSFG